MQIQRPQMAAAFELCFESLFNSGRGYAFPCDQEGHVDIDAVGDRARLNYYFARAMVGREYRCPVVQCKRQATASARAT